jgi:hypothetical protein
MPVLRAGLLNLRPSTPACSFTRRPHFQALSGRIFFNLPLHSNANNKVIDTQFTSVLYFLVFVKRISRRSPRSGNVQTCQRSDVLTSFTPNSHRIISFTDPHLLNSVVSYRYKITGGEGVSQAVTFSPTLPPVNPLTATLTKNRGGGPAFLEGMPSNPHSGTHFTVAYLPLFSITSTMPILQLLSFDGLPSNGGYPPPPQNLGRLSLIPYPYSLSFHILPHSFALTKITTLLFSSDSVLFAQNRGWGEGRVHHQRKALLLRERTFCSELETAN